MEEHARDQGAKKPKKRMSTAKRVVLFTLIGLLLFAGFLLGKFFYDINNPKALFASGPVQPAGIDPTPAPAPPTPPDRPNMQQAQTPAPTPTPDAEAMLLSEADLAFMKSRVNVLALGIDESTERASWGSFRTDTMILITIDFDTNKVDMISIPRDSYVRICNGAGKPTGAYSKINSAFSSGGGVKKSGYEYAMGTVSYLLGGIPVDYYVGFNMNVVKDVVNAMGGVDYDVDAEIRMNGRELHKGFQHLDGQAVLDYCRQRKDSSDLVRIDRQQRMLQAIFRQLKSTDQIGRIPEIYRSVEQNMQTNLSFTQISALALVALRMDMEQLGSHSLSGQSLMVRSRSCITLSSAKLEALVQEIFGIRVSVDSSINFSAVKARMEEERAAIAGELSAANAAIRTANGILGSYAAYLSESEAAALKSARDKLQEAVDDEEKAALDAYTPPLTQYNNQLLAALPQRGAAAQAPTPRPGSHAVAGGPEEETPPPQATPTPTQEGGMQEFNPPPAPVG